MLIVTRPRILGTKGDSLSLRIDYGFGYSQVYTVERDRYRLLVADFEGL